MSDRTTPWPGLFVALFACAALLWLGIDPVMVGLTLLLWAGSLFIGSPQPVGTGVDARRASDLRETMQDLFEQSATPVLITENNRVIIANEAARKLIGSHIVGQDVRIALRHPSAVALLEEDQDGTALVRGLVRTRDIWRISRKLLDGRLAAIEFVNKTAEADITRAHTDFVANASHELRTPLAAIIGYVETLRDEGDTLDKEQAGRFLDIVLREARRLQHLVSDLMSLSRIEAEKHDAPDTPVDLTALALRAIGDSAGHGAADRVTHAITEPWTVAGDQQQLEQVVRNLIDNALKYGAEGGKVMVAIEPEGDQRLRLTVRDEGEGIDPDLLPHLTRRFFRTDPGRSRASGGTGLGLAIVKHIVERHRGRLEITSAKGEGTTVAITLPRIAG